ncbi:hypothetical protein NB689_002618 [Xanthomonas sacchari]|nr:hypothetical protein [Xanthomonas sacchari]
MLRRRQVRAALHVVRPDDVRRIQRTGDHEAALRPGQRRLQQQPLQRRLAVVAVGAHVAQVVTMRLRLRPVLLRIERAVQRHRARRAVDAFQALQGRAAGEGQIQVIVRNQRRRQVGAVAALQRRQGHRGVDVVERDHAARGLLHPRAHGDAVGHVGTHDHQVRRGDRGGVPILQFLEAGIQHRRARQLRRRILVLGVPRHVALQEQHAVAARLQRGDQSAVGGGMAVAPGRAQAQAEDDDIARGHHAASRCRASSKASTSRARCV